MFVRVCVCAHTCLCIHAMAPEKVKDNFRCHIYPLLCVRLCMLIPVHARLAEDFQDSLACLLSHCRNAGIRHWLSYLASHGLSGSGHCHICIKSTLPTEPSPKLHCDVFNYY